MNEQVTNYIRKAPQEHQAIMEAVRALIHDTVGGVAEEYKWSRPVFRAKRDFAYLQANKSHVNLGFYNGIEKLEDPKGILQGTGNTMRHIKLKHVAEIDRKQLRAWFTALTKE